MDAPAGRMGESGRVATAELKSSLSRSCPDVPAEALDEFLERMDPGYFLGFPLEEVAAHLRLVASLDAARPVRVEIRRRRGRRMELVVAAFDYFGELSILCGVMASFGLDI